MASSQDCICEQCVFPSHWNVLAGKGWLSAVPSAEARCIRPHANQPTSARTKTVMTMLRIMLLRPNAAVQPQIRAQREFVGWNCLLDITLVRSGDMGNSLVGTHG